ncbi:hypothetical protein K9M09_01460 [Patescibacteria group bacterium]|nr:hypothetical protein [Patescibacteria group bacterium]
MNKQVLGPRNPFIPDEETLKNLEDTWNTSNPMWPGVRVVPVQKSDSYSLPPTSSQKVKKTNAHDWLSDMWSAMPVFTKH